MTIRLATNDDIAEITRVIRTVYDEYGFSWDEQDYHADLYDVQAHYFELGHAFWVAETDSVVGTAALERFSTLGGVPGGVTEFEGKVRIAGADCSLERLYVLPTARTLGVGSGLFEATIAEAHRSGRKRMEIWSDKRFEQAHRLYQRYGAAVIGDRICDDPDESPEWGLALDL